MKKFDELYSRRSDGKVNVWYCELDANQFRVVSGTQDGKKAVSGWTVCVGKNIGRSNETSPEQQAEAEVLALYKKKRSEKYSDDISKIDSDRVFCPMLAHKYEDHETHVEKHFLNKNIGIVWVSPKLDGMRCIASKDGLKSRNGKDIVSVPHITDALRPIFDLYPDFVFDGELYADKFNNDFNAIISLCKKSKPTQEDFQAAKQIDYHIYDMCIPDTYYVNRLATIESVLRQFPNPNLQVVLALQLFGVNSLQVFHDNFVEMGYEGMMIRLNGLYENKRSKNLLKYKDFQDDEFRIVEVLEGVGNKMGMAGSVVIDLGDGRIQKSNIRGNHSYLKDLLLNASEYIGKSATIRYFNRTPDNYLRFPYVVTIDRESYE